MVGAIAGTLKAGDRCGATLERGMYHYDHINPDWFSGCNKLENCQVLCLPCHLAKTKRDVRNIAKTKRIIKKQMRGYNKRTKLRGKFIGWRKFNGDLVWANRR
jgi:hypothetical protein